MRFDYETENDMKKVTFLVRFLSYSKKDKLRVRLLNRCSINNTSKYFFFEVHHTYKYMYIVLLTKNDVNVRITYLTSTNKFDNFNRSTLVHL